MSNTYLICTPSIDGIEQSVWPVCFTSGQAALDHYNRVVPDAQWHTDPKGPELRRLFSKGSNAPSFGVCDSSFVILAVVQAPSNGDGWQEAIDSFTPAIPGPWEQSIA